MWHLQHDSDALLVLASCITEEILRLAHSSTPSIWERMFSGSVSGGSGDRILAVADSCAEGGSRSTAEILGDEVPEIVSEGAASDDSSPLPLVSAPWEGEIACLSWCELWLIDLVDSLSEHYNFGRPPELCAKVNGMESFLI